MGAQNPGIWLKDCVRGGGQKRVTLFGVATHRHHVHRVHHTEAQDLPSRMGHTYTFKGLEGTSLWELESTGRNKEVARHTVTFKAYYFT
jgi:hypothetical protein